MKIFEFLFLLLTPVYLFAQQAAWELVRENFWGKVAIDPSNPNTIYVIHGDPEDYGLKKSTDGGQTWVNYKQGYEGLGSGEISGILIDPTNTQRLWVHGGSFKGIVRSEDGGLTAVRADTGIKFDHHGYSVMALAYDSRRNILYAGDFAIPFGGIYRSLDGGRSWQQLHRYSDDVLQFAPTFYLIEEDSGWVYSASTGNGIWRSKDFAITWQALHPELLAENAIYFVAQVPASRTLYAVGGELGKIYKSYDLGETWNIISPAILDSSILAGGLLVSTLDTNYLFVGAWGGSRDLGTQQCFICLCVVEASRSIVSIDFPSHL
ncbi:MAG: WD40/YVTN/BNR-like repeat-containing protein [bacterium]